MLKLLLVISRKYTISKADMFHDRENTFILMNQQSPYLLIHEHTLHVYVKTTVSLTPRCIQKCKYTIINAVQLYKKDNKTELFTQLTGYNETARSCLRQLSSATVVDGVPADCKYMYWHCTIAHKGLQAHRFIMKTYIFRWSLTENTGHQ